MILKLSQEEFDLMQTALVEYSRSIRDQARPHVCGYSAIGVDLCERRLRVEALLSDLSRKPPVLHPSPGSKLLEIPFRVAPDDAATPELVA